MDNRRNVVLSGNFIQKFEKNIHRKRRRRSQEKLRLSASELLFLG